MEDVESVDQAKTHGPPPVVGSGCGRHFTLATIISWNRKSIALRNLLVVLVGIGDHAGLMPLGKAVGPPVGGCADTPRSKIFAEDADLHAESPSLYRK